MTMAALTAVSGCMLAGVGCAPPAAKPSASSSAGAATAKSAADLGGMDGLVTAAKAEGALNVIALPPNWANYGKVIDGFKAKYGLTVNSAQPDAASQEEINAAKQLKGTDRAPDVFDLGQSVAAANTDMFAPYKVATFDTIATNFKDPDGTWVNDYGGYMSIGYDSKKVPEVKSVEDLMGSGVQGQGRPERQPDPGRGRLQRRDDGLRRQRRVGRRHPARDRLLRQAQAGGQLLAARPDRRHHRVRPDPASSSTGTT